MGFFDKLFKKDKDAKEAPKAAPKAAEKPKEAPKAAAAPAAAPAKPAGSAGNPGPYDFIVPPVAMPGDSKIPAGVQLEAADLGPTPLKKEAN